ncbi:unnamed protein product [Peniophora sp. CBMAI 1063]|nr:unnamed protein product [Peniophora sp. CBMAI 1063]
MDAPSLHEPGVEGHHDEGSLLIAKLPPELLSEIFVFYAHHPSINALYHLEWTSTLLSVCRRWHDVAVSTPALWSYIEFSGPPHQIIPRVSLQLRRAGDAPLHLRGIFHAHTVEVLQDTCCEIWNVANVKELTLNSIHWRGGSLQEFLRRMNLPAYPLLTHLSILSSQEPLNFELDLMVALLRTKLPRLSHLRLEGVPFDPSLLHNLSRLHLGSLREGHDLPQDALPELIYALQRCPDMQDLNLHLGGHLPPQPSFGESASLPLLQTLSLQGHPQACALMIQAFQLPRSVGIKLLFAPNWQTLRETNLIQALNNHFVRTETPTISSLLINTELFDGPVPVLCFRAYTDPGYYALRGRSQTANGNEEPPCLDVHLWHRSPDISLTLDDLVQGLPMTCVTHLDGRFATRVALKSWIILLSALPSLRVVSVRPETAALDLLLALNILLNRQQRPVAHIVLDLRLMPEKTASTHEADAKRARLSFEEALQYIQKAKQVGLPLDTLEIVGDIPYGMIGDVWLEEMRRSLNDGFRFRMDVV